MYIYTIYIKIQHIYYIYMYTYVHIYIYLYILAKIQHTFKTFFVNSTLRGHKMGVLTVKINIFFIK